MSTGDKRKKNTIEVDKSLENKCPKKDGDNCLVPGVFSDSEPIGGG